MSAATFIQRRAPTVGKALVLALRPRLTFIDHTAPYPKDLVLVAWGPYVAPGFDLWLWKGEA